MGISSSKNSIERLKEQRKGFLFFKHRLLKKKTFLHSNRFKDSVAKFT